MADLSIILILHYSTVWEDSRQRDWMLLQRQSFHFMETIENLDDLLGAVAVWENRDLFYKVMQSISSWQYFGVIIQFIEDTSTLLLVHIGSKSTCVGMKVHTAVFHILNSS